MLGPPLRKQYIRKVIGHEEHEGVEQGEDVESRRGLPEQIVRQLAFAIAGTRCASASLRQDEGSTRWC